MQVRKMLVSTGPIPQSIELMQKKRQGMFKKVLLYLFNVLDNAETCFV
jgi:hypothetical protein